MTTQQRAAAELAALARALAALPDRRGTVAEICAATGLDRAAVVRRLRSSGAAVAPAGFEPAFAAIRGRTFGKSDAVWFLTARGARIAEGGE